MNMITVQNHNGRQTWRVDRPSLHDKGYQEDAPPVAILTGAIAGAMVPTMILTAAASDVYSWFMIVAIVCAVIFVAAVVYTWYTLLGAERRWQERKVQVKELSDPSGPAQSGPEAHQLMS